MVVRRDCCSIENAEVDELKEHPNVEMMFNTEVVRVEGDSAIRKVVLRNRVTGKETIYTAPEMILRRICLCRLCAGKRTG